MKIYILLFLFFFNISSSISQIRWEKINLPENYKGAGFQFVNKSLGYFLVYQDCLYKTTNMGNSFIEINIPDIEEKSFNIILLNDDIIMLGEDSYIAGINYFYYSSNEGNTWKQFDESFTKQFSVINSKSSYKLDHLSNGKIGFFKTLNFGVSWNKYFEFKDNNKSSDELNQEDKLFFLNNDIGFYYGRYNCEEDKRRYRSSNDSRIFLYKTTNAGLKWKNIKDLEEYNDIFTVYFEDEKNGFILCSKNDDKGNVVSKHLLKTTNGGINWKQVPNEKEWKEFIYSLDEFEFQIYNGKILTKNINNIFEDLKLIYSKNFNRYIDFIEPDIYMINVNGNIFKSSNSNNSISTAEVIRLIEVEERFITLRNEADESYKEKEYLISIFKYFELISNGISDFNIYFYLGYSCDELEIYDDAIKYYEKALDLDTNNYNAINNIGVCYEKLGNYEFAKKYYESAISIDSENKLALNNLKLLNDLMYSMSPEDYNILYKYFPINKSESIFLYICNNNSAPVQAEVVLPTTSNDEIGYSVRNYYRSVSGFQNSFSLLKEEKKYILKGNKLICNVTNPQIGKFSETKFKFPLEIGTSWKNVLGFNMEVIKFDATVTTTAGTFTNCLMIKSNLLTEYYAPGIGLVLSLGYDGYGNSVIFDELTNYYFKE